MWRLMRTPNWRKRQDPDSPPVNLLSVEETGGPSLEGQLHDAEKHSAQRFAWARLNAYGLLIAGLVLLSAARVLQPGKTSVARVLGRVPEYQYVWLAGFGLAGLLMLYGLVRAKTGPEVLGLAIVVVSLSAQTVALIVNAGSDESWSAVAVWIVAVACIALRASVLLSRDGMSIIISGREKR